ncbi:MAG: cytochrome C biogenesis protein DipZ [Patescibacteria group bacterium]|nr:MAG: cytochrome C biogenesis protein DipZ [Patescibacteria group bacterium]
MGIVLIFAFASGFVTALTPCVLPVLPIVLASTATSGRRRAVGVIVGLIGSFTFFTLFLTYLVKYFNLPGDLLRNLAIGVLLIFGMTMLFPRVQHILERLTSKMTGKLGGGLAKPKEGFGGGVIVGVILGLLWTPCAGPILASVIALAATSSVTLEAVLITFAYICGSAVVLLAFAYGGKGLIAKLKGLNTKSGMIQRIFGGVIVSMALILFLEWDRKFQEILVQNLPTWALTPLVSLESSEFVSKALDTLAVEEQDRDVNFDQARLLSNYGKAAELEGGTGWINSEPMRLADLKGKVVLVDFWTYSCVNCIRTLPYLKQWDERYREQGLVTVGVHAPEFAFEREERNVSRAVEEFGLKYPVLLDNDFRIWREYQGARGAWPAKYLIDQNGVIRFRHIGEGRYDETERAIQLLLAESGKKVDYEIEKQALISYREKTAETYMGYGRLDPARWKVEGEIGRDVFRNYEFGGVLGKGELALSGSWKVTKEYAQPGKGAKLRLVFFAEEVNLVMAREGSTGGVEGVKETKEVAVTDTGRVGENVCTNEVCIGGVDPASDGSVVEVRVLDTRMINTNADLVSGRIYVNEPRMYRLVSLERMQEKIVELEFLEEGIQLYAWTF